MSGNMVESIIGAVVLLVTGWFLFYAYERTNLDLGDSHILVAQFDRVDGIVLGADVRLSGIKVGSVVKQEVDHSTYRAKLTFTVPSELELPIDTGASITSDGLLGGAYLSLSPGFDEEFLLDGDEIAETQDAIDFFSLLAKLTSGDSSKSDK